MADQSMFKRFFSKKKESSESVSKSHRYPILMWQAIEHLAEEAGESPNAFVVMILDQYLQVQLDKGKLKLEALAASDKTA